MKSAEKDLHNIFQGEEHLAQLAGFVKCEKPNNAIYKYEGTIQIPQKQSAISLGADNLCLRGSTLRNTDYIYGCVVYQGHQTKIM